MTPGRERGLSYESSPLAAVMSFHLTPSSPNHRLEAAGLSAPGRRPPLTVARSVASTSPEQTQALPSAINNLLCINEL